MKIRQKFSFYNLIMFLAPVLMIGVVSVVFLIIFIMKFPVEELSLSRAALLNPVTLIRAFGQFFKNHPGSISYVFLWLLICTVIIAVSTTVVTRLMVRSIERPIKSLTDSVESIKNGCLSFEVMGSDYDELNELCEGFDEMRRGLIAADEREADMKRERSLLIANTSHDLKTPITAIKGYIDGINDGVADTPEKLKRYLDTIRRKADTIDNLVNNLSIFSKLELSHLEFSFAEGDLREPLRDVLEGCRLDLDSAGIQLEAELGDEPLIVRMDAEKLRRVFSNIIENSIKYRRPESEKLTVKARKSGGSVYVFIEDDGMGIEPAELNKVFDSFYRTDESRTSQIKGNGLGLGIALQIMRRHGGKMWLKSDGLGKGTTAILCLPSEDGGGKKGDLQ